MKKTLTVALPGREYQIEIQRGLLDQAGSAVGAAPPGPEAGGGDRQQCAAPVSGADGGQPEAGGLSGPLLLRPAGEAAKCPEQLVLLWEKMMAFGMTRTDGVAALGGGVVGDLAGFAAATLLRGVDFIQIPPLCWPRWIPP